MTILRYSLGRRLAAAVNCLRGRPTAYRCTIHNGSLMVGPHHGVAIENRIITDEIGGAA